jgi:hypothetical protein
MPEVVRDPSSAGTSVDVNVYCLAKIIIRLWSETEEDTARALKGRTATAHIDRAVYDALNAILRSSLRLEGLGRRCDPWTEPDCIDWG